MKTIESVKFQLLPSFLENLFGQNTELLSSVDELFELELAYLEYNTLPKQDLLNRLAYFKSIDGKPTKHFLMCVLRFCTYSLRKIGSTERNNFL